MADGKRQVSKLPPIPAWLIYVIIISVVASWIPLSLIAVSRVQRSERPRVHIFQDMGIQPRYEGQAPSDLFADGRAMRQPVDGTVARDELNEDDHYYRGYETDDDAEPIMEDGEPAYYDGMPEQIEVTREMLERGRERYNINCATCHGSAGYGDGLTHQRVAQLNEAAAREGRDIPAEGWVQPVNLHTRNADGAQYGEENYPAGKLFYVISEGIRTMPSYKQQISVEDRWAIVAYVRALQLSQAIPVAELPEDVGELGDPIDPPPSAAGGPDAEDVEVSDVDLQDPELIAQGQQLFQSKICFTCHQTQEGVEPANPLPGPSFVDGIFGEERRVHIGINGPIETVEVDEEYFVESITAPQEKIVEDYGPPRMMPPQPITEDEVLALMAYVKSLGEADEGGDE